MRKLRIICIFISIFFVTCLCSCEPHNSKNITDFPNSLWVTESDEIINVEVYVDSESLITSNITYKNETLEFTNYIVSEVIYFTTKDEAYTFTVSHSYVKNESKIKCRLKKKDIINIFEIEEDIDVISFELIKHN